MSRVQESQLRNKQELTAIQQRATERGQASLPGFACACGSPLNENADPGGRWGRKAIMVCQRSRCSLVTPYKNRITDYFGIGKTMSASSANVVSPVLPLMRYWIFNCFTPPGRGSPPKLVL